MYTVQLSLIDSTYKRKEHMNVLVACEESQEVCKAFRERGHNAYSCDLQDCSGGHPEWHIFGDCLPLLDGNCNFSTMGGGVGEHQRTLGSDHCTSPMYLSYGFRKCMVRFRKVRKESGAKVEGQSARCGFLYAVHRCGLRQDRSREPDRNHVISIQETGSDHSTIPVRT